MAAILSSSNPLWVNLDLIAAFRYLYLLAAASIIGIRLIPPLKDRFLDYGPRNDPPKGLEKPQATETPMSFLDRLASMQVSHSRFKDFYVTSIICSDLWLAQQHFHGKALQVVQQHAAARFPQNPTPAAKTSVCLILMTIHGLRRYYESESVAQPSTSKMWIGHYALGLLFYSAINASIIIEHAPADTTSTWIEDAVKTCLSYKNMAAMVLFVEASQRQYSYHAYLALLQKYSLPHAAEFGWIVAPHYAAECMIYFAFAILSAPNGKLFNNTVLCALVFVMVNLGVTADRTKKWMMEKFKDQRGEVEKRWRMIPWVW